MTGPRLVLASGSPRRALLLAAAGFAFSTVVPDIDESPLGSEPPFEYVLRIAGAKAIAVERSDDDVVLAADTTVVLDDTMIGKPEDDADALGMLSRLAGRSHLVLTGWTALGSQEHRFGVEETTVRFHDRSEVELADYVARTRPLDKAGAYALQGDDGWLVASVTGSRSNVMGLPIQPIVSALADLGIRRSTA